MRINFYVIEENIGNVTSFFDNIIKTYKFASKEAKQKHKKLEVNITFTTNKEIQQINQEKRNIDKPTDVLSFPMLEVKGQKINKRNFKQDYNKETKTIFIGDIVISVEKAKEQALKYGHSVNREIVFLALHGLLHCYGFEHETEKDEKIMFAMQNYILNKCGIKR